MSGNQRLSAVAAVSEAQWSTLLHYATMAPSSHNTQPWRFRVRQRTTELWADRSRSLPVVDPYGRELVISCGALLLNLRVALEHFGVRYRVSLVPEPGNADLLARIAFVGEEGSQEPASDDLFNAIGERRTNRFPFKADPVPADVLQELQHAARDEGARLVPLRADTDRRHIAELIAEGDLRQASDLGIRREMAHWVRANDSSRRDGLRGYSFGHGRLASLVAPWYVRFADWGEAQAGTDRELALTAPILAVLGTEEDAPADWLRAGQALSRVLLTAKSRGLSSSFFNQPVQIEDLRSQLGALVVSAGYPQLCLRFGYGGDVLPTPRRPLEEIVEVG